MLYGIRTDEQRRLRARGVRGAHADLLRPVVVPVVHAQDRRRNDHRAGQTDLAGPRHPAALERLPARSVANHDSVAIPEIKNVVIYLKGVKFKGPLQVSRQEIRQEHEAFVPRVSP